LSLPLSYSSTYSLPSPSPSPFLLKSFPSSSLVFCNRCLLLLLAVLHGGTRNCQQVLPRKNSEMESTSEQINEVDHMVHNRTAMSSVTFHVPQSSRLWTCPTRYKLGNDVFSYSSCSTKSTKNVPWRITFIAIILKTNVIDVCWRDTSPGMPMRDSLSVSRMLFSSTMSFQVFWHFLGHGGTVTCEVPPLLSFSFYA